MVCIRTLIVSLLFLTGSMAVSMYQLPPQFSFSYDVTCSPQSLVGSYTFYEQAVEAYSVSTEGFIALSDSCVSPPFVDVYYAISDVINLGEATFEGMYFGEYQGASPIDPLVQIQSNSYIGVTWNRIGYPVGNSDRLNSFQAIIASDNTDTYACFIYPDAAATGNPNGGIDWTTPNVPDGTGGTDFTAASSGFSSSGFASTYSHPDSFTDRIRGIDGVPGDGSSASFVGTHAPGQFCYVISGAEIGVLGPATITSPSAMQIFSLSTSPSIAAVPFAATGLLVSKQYTIRVNNVDVLTFTSSRLGRTSSTLNLSSFADGTLTISLVRNSDSVTVSRQIVKDTASFVTITSPSGSQVTNQANVFNLAVGGTGEVGGSVVVTIQDSTSSTADIVSAAVLVASNGNWQTAALSLASLADGAIRIRATITDAAGNVASSNTVTINKDTRVSVSILSPSSLQFVVTAARAPTLTVSGFADPGSTVIVSVNDAFTSSVSSPRIQVSTVGTWSVVINVARLGDGLLTIVATASDAVGNSANSVAVNLNKDAVLSGFAITTPTNGGSVVNAEAFVISGTGETGGTVSLRITANSPGTGVITRSLIRVINGAWSTTVDVRNLLTVGRSITISGTGTDPAGNFGSLSPVSVTRI